MSSPPQIPRRISHRLFSVIFAWAISACFLVANLKAAALVPGVVCGTTNPAPDAEYALNPSRMPATGYGADTLDAHFFNPEGTVAAVGHWTSSPAKYLIAADYTRLSAKSKYCSRDMEVDAWSRNGMVFLRLTDDGDAIYFHHNGETGIGGTLEIGVVKGLIEGIGFRYADKEGGGTFYPLYGTSNLSSVASNYRRSATDGQIFTFGVSGFDIYAKVDGVEFMRFKDYRHLKPGRAATQANKGYGFRTIGVRTLANAALASDPDAGLIDLRDFGLKSISALGSIAANTNELTLTTAAGFAVGDNVIVSVGGESGRGRYGSVGVGGTWPPKSYASPEARDADTRQSEGTWASLPSGDVFRSSKGKWYREKRYYLGQISPQALAAKIVAVSGDGRTLTLDRKALAGASDARVYFDNRAILNRLGRAPGFLAPATPKNVTLFIPEGDYAVSDTVVIAKHPRWTIAGAGKTATRLFSPPGSPSINVVIQEAKGVTVRDLRFEGNARAHGFGLTPSGNGFKTALMFLRSDDGVAQDVTFTDVFVSINPSYSDRVWVHRADTVMTEGLRTYVQWQFQWADATGGGCVDCRVTSTALVHGFESFRSKSIHFIRPVGINAAFAMNTSGDFLIQDANLSFKNMSQLSEESFHPLNPIIDVNSNLDAKSELMQLGGKIVNATIVQEGHINAKGDILKGIVINDKNPNISVLGGKFISQSYSGSNHSGGIGVDSNGANTLVDGFTVVGAVYPHAYPGFNIRVVNGFVRNCVADRVRVETGRVENCKMNSASLGR